MFPSYPWSKLICFYDSAAGPFKQLLKKGRRKRRIRITSYLGVNSVVEWLGKCLIFSADLPAQFLSPLSGSYSRTSHGRWFIFPFRPFPLSCAVVQLWPSANNIPTARDIVVALWLASFSSEILARLHHLLIIIFFFSLFSRGFWCRRSTRVVRACRAATTAPDSGLTSGGKSLFKKKKTMSFEPLYFPTLVIVVVKHLTRNTHERKFPPLPFVFLLVKNTFGRSSNDRTAKTTTQMEMAVVAYPLCAHVFQLT